MDYSKQEDRLTNNKYHYYIKHYLNSNDQIVDKSGTEIQSQTSLQYNPKSTDYVIKNVNLSQFNPELVENSIDVKSSKSINNQVTFFNSYCWNILSF